MNKFTISLIASSVFLFQSAFSQSIGVSFVSDGNTDTSSGITDTNADSMLGTDVAGVAPYTQTNWNNFGARGSGTARRLIRSVMGSAAMLNHPIACTPSAGVA